MTHHVLIVDDDPDIRMVAAASLEHLRGWRVDVAASGDEALTMAANLRPEVVLLDVMMPGQDGPATLARLLADPATASIPVVFLTAKVRGPERDRLLALGARGVIAKPFDPLTLADQVSGVVGFEP